MKTLIISLTLALVALISPVTASEVPSTTETHKTIASVSMPTCEGDELCFTLESEARAYELVEEYNALESSTVPMKLIYVGYYDTLPNLDTFEGYVAEPNGAHYYVFSATPEAGYSAA